MVKLISRSLPRNHEIVQILLEEFKENFHLPSLFDLNLKDIGQGYEVHLCFRPTDMPAVCDLPGEYSLFNEYMMEVNSGIIPVLSYINAELQKVLYNIKLHGAIIPISSSC